MTERETDPDTCPTCHGAGEVPTGDVDPETNWPHAEQCWTCLGGGVIPTNESRRIA